MMSSREDTRPILFIDQKLYSLGYLCIYLSVSIKCSSLRRKICFTLHCEIYQWWNSVGVRVGQVLREGAWFATSGWSVWGPLPRRQMGIRPLVAMYSHMWGRPAAGTSGNLKFRKLHFKLFTWVWIGMQRLFSVRDFSLLTTVNAFLLLPWDQNSNKKRNHLVWIVICCGLCSGMPPAGARVAVCYQSRAAPSWRKLHNRTAHYRPAPSKILSGKMEQKSLQ
jgi:hypothetical protein